MRKSKMFEGLRTYNPYFGCNHHCYHDGCWACKLLAHRQGTRFNCQKCYDFEPHLHPERLNRVPIAPRLFVGAHCDLWGNWVSINDIGRVLAACREHQKKYPKTLFFFETKNPIRYESFAGLFPENTILSVTIETNRDYGHKIMGCAPAPVDRFTAFYSQTKLRYRKHVAIEPIMDFDMVTLLGWIRSIRPVKVAVGYDSLNNNLPEPPKSKTRMLIQALEEFTEVERKKLD